MTPAPEVIRLNLTKSREITWFSLFCDSVGQTQLLNNQMKVSVTSKYLHVLKPLSVV